MDKTLKLSFGFWLSWFMAVLPLLAVPARAQILSQIISSSGNTVTYSSNSCTNSNSASSTTIACTITGVTSGQTLAVEGGFSTGSTSGTLSVADTGSHGSVITAISTFSWNVNAARDALFVIANAASGSHAVTVTSTVAGTFGTLFVFALNGASLTSPLDSTATPATGTLGSTSGTKACNSLNTAQSNEFLFEFAEIAGSATISGNGTPQTMTTMITGTNANGLYGNAVTPGSNFAQWNFSAAGSSGQSWMCELISLH